ncbi:MAG: hypothetical protein K6A43_10040 [Treponema sp.]|nr:hypothetical protein [Treponema sp.]
MEKMGQGQKQSQKQSQLQTQILSQQQIQALKFLAMPSRDLREEILSFANENPALEIVHDPLSTNISSDFSSSINSANKNGNSSMFKDRIHEDYSSTSSSAAYQKSQDAQAALEATQDRTQTLQQHLMNQLNLTKLPPDEYELCQKLIYNLDKDGCYGSMLAPESFLDKTKKNQNAAMLERCLDRIQRMDPVGNCCKNIEESLYIQAKINGNASPLTLFILNGHLDFLNPPYPEKILRRLNKYKQEWHSKTFATPIILDKITLDEATIEETLLYIRQLNPHPAGEYISDTTISDFDLPDVVLEVHKKQGRINSDDFERGRIILDDESYLQITKANGILPEVRISPDFSFSKDAVFKAKEFISKLQFRESSIFLQGCAIVWFQKDFFKFGPGHIKKLTRQQVAEKINVHESTVSRMTARKNNKFLRTEWGLFPANYFFSSGTEDFSAEMVKAELKKILDSNPGEKFSDSKLTAFLNERGIKVARRTVAKYRTQMGLVNSYGK